MTVLIAVGVSAIAFFVVLGIPDISDRLGEIRDELRKMNKRADRE